MYHGRWAHFHKEHGVSEAIVISELLEDGLLIQNGIAVPLKFIITGEAAVQGCDLIRCNSGGLSIQLFHDMLLSDSPQAGTTYSRTIADKSRVIEGL